eukprot:PhM_4_TR11290/c3_g1_i1/m.93293
MPTASSKTEPTYDSEIHHHHDENVIDSHGDAPPHSPSATNASFAVSLPNASMDYRRAGPAPSLRSSRSFYTQPIDDVRSSHSAPRVHRQASATEGSQDGRESNRGGTIYRPHGSFYTQPIDDEYVSESDEEEDEAEAMERRRAQLQSRSITARDMAHSYHRLDRQNWADRERLMNASLTEEQKHTIEHYLQQREQVAESLNMYAQTTSMMNWYTPFSRRPSSDEVPEGTRWGVFLIQRRELLVVCNGNIVDFDVPVMLLRGVILVLWWFMWYHILQRDAGKPGSAFFDTIVTVAVSSIIGGTLSTVASLPPLIGILVWGTVWASLPGGLTDGIPKVMLKLSKDIGATVILLKAGLSLNVKALRSVAWVALAMATIPIVLEAACHFSMTDALHSMDTTTGWLLGFALAGTSPALVVPGGFVLQELGRGVKSGMLSMLYAASALNVAVCLLVFNVLFDAKFQDTDLTLMLVMIPVQIVCGVLLGLLLAFIVYNATRVLMAHRLEDDTLYYYVERYLTLMLIGCGISLTLASNHYKYPGGGIIGVFTFAVMCNHLFTRDADDELMIEIKHTSSHDISAFWDVLIQPFLFAMVGSSTTFSKLFEPSLLPKSLLTFAVGLAGRTVGVLGVVRLFSSFTWKEALFCAFAWYGKATPQAALGGKISDFLSGKPSGEYSADVIEHGDIVLSQSVLSIFLIGPLAAILMRAFGESLVRSDRELEDVPHDVVSPGVCVVSQELGDIDGDDEEEEEEEGSDDVDFDGDYVKPVDELPSANPSKGVAFRSNSKLVTSVVEADGTVRRRVVDDDPAHNNEKRVSVRNALKHSASGGNIENEEKEDE